MRRYPQNYGICQPATKHLRPTSIAYVVARTPAILTGAADKECMEWWMGEDETPTSHCLEYTPTVASARLHLCSPNSPFCHSSTPPLNQPNIVLPPSHYRHFISALRGDTSANPSSCTWIDSWHEGLDTTASRQRELQYGFGASWTCRQHPLPNHSTPPRRRRLQVSRPGKDLDPHSSAQETDTLSIGSPGRPTCPTGRRKPNGLTPAHGQPVAPDTLSSLIASTTHPRSHSLKRKRWHGLPVSAPPTGNHAGLLIGTQLHSTQLLWDGPLLAFGRAVGRGTSELMAIAILGSCAAWIVNAVGFESCYWRAILDAGWRVSADTTVSRNATLCQFIESTYLA
uniref:Uncharacterized protein n=1 Tax=Echinococcus granulosus TaxID=6210 RepID=A0A068WU97_ECHGR|nr:hypothetical protein EgrG_002040300 [Echinococcus granulosus]